MSPRWTYGFHYVDESSPFVMILDPENQGLRHTLNDDNESFESFVVYSCEKYGGNQVVTTV